jgi:endonuclease/exonuclease/phosphatase family metal-dependent hydrolase
MDGTSLESPAAMQAHLASALAWCTVCTSLCGCGPDEHVETAPDRVTAVLPQAFPSLVDGFAVDSGAPAPDAGRDQQRPAPSSRPLKTAKLKVMTFNVRGHAQTPSTLSALASFIAAQDPDLVALEEVYRYVANNANQAAIVAAALWAMHGKKYTTFYLEQHSFVVAGIGVAVLSKHPITSTSAHGLPVVESEGRVVLRAAIDAPLRPVDLFVTHLTNKNEGVLTQAKDLVSWVSGFAGRPKLLAGDFNASPSSAVYSLLGGSFLDTWSDVHGPSGGFTISADKPTVRIDFIFADRASGTKALEARVVGDPKLSDHLSLISTVEIHE